MSDEQFGQLMAVLQRQNELIVKLCQIQESILILLADDREPEEESHTYLSGKPKR
jgi:hypothetical protein